MNDEQAVRRLQSGEEDALIALYDKYQERVFRFAMRLLGRIEDAEEVVADTFLQAFRRCRTYREEGPFSAWLFRIARNLCFMRLRSPRRFSTVSLDELLDEGQEFVGWQASHDQNLSTMVRAALECLPPDYRLVLTMRELDGLTNAETAQALGRTPSSAKSLHFRARRALRDAVVEALGKEE
ncbi:MAG: RNA polymerase sigma factor [Armatimonadota bacterium]